MTLRYPLEIGAGAFTDYVQFTPLQYRANNRTIAGQRGDPAAGAGAAGAQSVILYMPQSSPMVGNTNKWNAETFAGPLGELKKLGGAGIANTISEQSGFDPRETISNVTKQFQQLKSGADGKLGGAAKQFALDMIPKELFGATGAQFLAMSKGQTYNPNAELLYSAPGMRPFNFSFNFVPKSAAEASNVNRIILNFKRWSAPADLQNGMFEVPHVWQVKYMSKGQTNKNMNQFKQAACTSVTVQANPSTSMHVAHEDGMPIETVMSLSFQEVDVITRQDHENAQGQGF